MIANIKNLSNYVSVLALLLQACTTMDAISDSAKSFGKGDIGDGIGGAIYAMSVAPLTDIVTLGGTMSAEEGAKAWAGAANEYAKASQPTTTGKTTIQAPNSGLSSAQQLAMATNALATTLDSTNNQTSTSDASSPSQTTSNLGRKSYKLPSLNALAENNQLVNTADGFEFRVYNGTKYQDKLPYFEASGGPCTNAGIIGMQGRLDEVINALRPDYKRTHYLHPFSEPSRLKGLRVLGAISGNKLADNRYALNTQETRRLYESAKANKVKRSELEPYYEEFKFAECLEMSHMQYVLAFENWAKRNKKPLLKIINQHWPDTQI